MATKMMKKNSARAFIGIWLLGGLVSQAHAVPILRLTSSAGGSVTVTDGGLLDSNASAGVVLFNGSVAGWVVNVTTGLSKPSIGSELEPILDLNSVNVSSGGAGTLRIELTDTDFSRSGLLPAYAAIGGTTSGSVSYSTYFGSSNLAFEQTASLADPIGPLLPTAFSSYSYGTFSAPDPYSLSLVVEVNHGSGGTQVSSFDAVLSVSEPNTVFLLGAGLLLAGIMLRRQRSSNSI